MIKSITGAASGPNCRHAGKLDEVQLQVKSARQPTPKRWAGLLFAWKVVKHVKSNAIVYARAGQTISAGAGQMSRVDCRESRSDEGCAFVGEFCSRLRCFLSVSRTAWKRLHATALPLSFNQAVPSMMRLDRGGRQAQL